MSKAARCYFVVLFSLFVMFLYISNTLIGVVNQQQYNGTKDFINGLINEWQAGQELQEWTTNEVAPNILYLESVNDSFVKETSTESTVHALSENVSSFCSKSHSNAQKRLKDHCNTRSQNWTEHHWVQFSGATLIVENKGELAYCHVPKVASTAWMLTFASMNLMPQYEIDRKVKSMSLHDHLYDHFSLKMRKPEDISILSPFYKFVFLRHPFERLVSAFHDKFIVVKQLNLMEPFIKYHLESKGMKTPTLLHLRKRWIEQNVEVSFENFVDFVLYEASLSQRISGPSGHWWPYTDMCKICEIDYDYIGKLETLADDVACILQNFPNYDLLQQMKSRIKVKVNASGNHNRNMTIDYFSQLTKPKIIELYNMYKDDFAIGGYDYPQKYIDVGL